MLRKILSLVFNYDKATPRVAAYCTSGSKSTRETLATTETGTVQSGRSIYSPSNKMEIPDPWD